MRPSAVLKRLGLPATMASFLLLALAYWWQGNGPHEIFGTALFALVAWHIVANRMWFTSLLRGRYDARRVIAVALHLGLIVSMVILLVTSIAISQTVLTFLPLPNSFAMRQVHLFTAYWAMIAVGSHLGLHWTKVMSTTRVVLGLSPPNTVRTWVLRLAAAFIFLLGLNSITALDLWNKLTFTASMVFWDFTTSIAPFFWHWAAVVSLPVIAVHYCLVILRTAQWRRVNVHF